MQAWQHRKLARHPTTVVCPLFQHPLLANYVCLLIWAPKTV